MRRRVLSRDTIATRVRRRVTSAIVNERGHAPGAGARAKLSGEYVGPSVPYDANRRRPRHLACPSRSTLLAR